MTGLDGLIPVIVRPMAELFAESKTAAGILVGGGMLMQYGLHWFFGRRNLAKSEFRNRLLFVGVSFHEGTPGEPVRVEFDTHGDEYELSEVVGIPHLERQIIAATRRSSDGILRLKNGSAHARMMSIFEDHIRGNDPVGGMAAIMGRPTHRDPVALMPTFIREESEEGDELSIIRVYIVAEPIIRGRLQDDVFRARLAPVHDRHAVSIGVIKRMAELVNEEAEARRGTAVVRYTTVTTAKLADESGSSSAYLFERLEEVS